MDRADIVIVGGGLAGAVAAESYRKAGGTGSVTILSTDPDLPVHRPPLSKEYLRGDEQRERVFVHPPDFYREQGIDVHVRSGVERIDLASRRVALEDASHFGFGSLVLATGARPRRLQVPGADLDGVHYLRSLRSSERLRTVAEYGSRAVIVGAGFIGMEAAASLAQRGVHCTIVETFPRVWARLLPQIVSEFVQQYFRDRGVDFRFGVPVREMQGDRSVEYVVLEDGERLPADLVVAGVGALLNTKLAAEARLEEAQGVVVDEFLRTAHPAVFAIGDIAAFPDPIAGRIHLEHWDNALHQGRAVGATLAGEETRFDHIAYFFSDLFDLSLNMVGYPAGWDDVLVRGDVADGRFTMFYVKGGVLRAALTVNDDAHLDTWTQLVRAQVLVREKLSVLTDPHANPGVLSGR